MSKKSKLLKQLAEIEKAENAAAQEKEREENWQMFLNRPSDWLVGKAHAEQIPSGGFDKFPYAVHVYGNAGVTYTPNLRITKSTHIYFHNVWSERDRQDFQTKLNELAQSEIERIGKSLRIVLEILGLQSNNYWLDKIPSNKAAEAKKMIWDETVSVLDAYPDEDYLKLSGVSLSHGRAILDKYITEKRPHLTDAMKENE